MSNELTIDTHGCSVIQESYITIMDVLMENFITKVYEVCLKGTLATMVFVIGFLYIIL